MSKKLQFGVHLSIGIILFALLVVASLYDEVMSKAAFVGNGVAYIGAVIGKLPAWILLAFAASVLCKSAMNKERRYKGRMPLVIIYSVIVFASAFMTGYSIVEDVIDGFIKYIIAAIICVAGSISMYVIVNGISLDIINRLRKWAFIAIFCIAVIVLLTGALKIVWGRVRYVDIISGDGIFTPWYKPNGITGGSSFPSGHTALASCMFLLPLMFLSLPSFKPYASSMFLLACIYTVFVAITRISGGYHFVSDTVISIIIAYSTIFVSYGIGFGVKLDRTMLSDNNILNKF